MNAYGIVLFLHLTALLGAMATSGVAHLADARLRGAETVAAARQWLPLLAKASRVFPGALLVLLASGAYLVHRDWAWSDGWVIAGLVGVFSLAANGGGVLGRHNRAIARALATTDEGPLPPTLRELTRGRTTAVASWANTGIAIGVVFVMSTKPALVGSLASLAVAALLGSGMALWQVRHAR